MCEQCRTVSRVCERYNMHVQVCPFETTEEASNARVFDTTINYLTPSTNAGGLWLEIPTQSQMVAATCH